MRRTNFAHMALAMAVMVPLSGLLHGAQVQVPRIDAGNGPIICSIIEAFEGGRLGVRAIIFHQHNKADGPRLGALLLAHSGEEMELETTGGPRYRATVFRIKSAFGRGLVLVPTSMLKLGAHDEFTLRQPEKD
jgi:hypothetical protein